MNAETKKRFIRLKELAADAYSNIYERVKLASEVLKDSDWIIETYDGDSFVAREAVQSEYFADLGGYVKLPTLLNILDMFPTEETWRHNRYDLRAMEIEYANAQKSNKEPKTGRKTATLAQLQEKDETIARLRASLKAEKEKVRRLEAENKQLKDEIESLHQVGKAA